jgi:hypothetical protein
MDLWCSRGCFLFLATRDSAGDIDCGLVGLKLDEIRQGFLPTMRLLALERVQSVLLRQAHEGRSPSIPDDAPVLCDSVKSTATRVVSELWRGDILVEIGAEHSRRAVPSA